MISIMIPTMSPALLQMTLRSVRKNLQREIQVIVFDNLGADRDIRAISSRYGAVYLTDASNVGIPEAYKRMCERVRHDLLFTADDDYYYLPDWDKVLLGYMTADAGSKEYFARAPVMIEPLGGNDWTIQRNFGRTINDFREEELLAAVFEFDERSTPNGPVAVSRKTWEALGGWDTDYFPGFGADPDFSYRLLQLAGGDRSCLLTAPGSYYYHFSGSTSGTAFSHVPRQESHRLFLKKHGCTIRSFVDSLR